MSLADFKEFGMYATRGLLHPFTTATWIPPRQRFFDDLTNELPDEMDAILEIGPGGGRLMETIIEKRKKLSENGVYIAVDCDNGWLNFIRKNRKVAQDPRVHLVHGFAQHCREDIEKILEGRKINMNIKSFPSTLMHKDDVEAIQSFTAELSADDGQEYFYNVGSPQKYMTPYWKELERLKVDYSVNWGFPMRFQLWHGKNPVRDACRNVLANGGINGNGQANGKTHKGLGYLMKHLQRQRRRIKQ